MKSMTKAIRVSALALALAAVPMFAANAAGKANEPAFNVATMTQVDGTIAAVKQVPNGNPLAGTHLTVATKTGNLDVYLGPTEFLRIFKTNFPVGAYVNVIGSKVAFQNAAVVLANQIGIGSTDITLRDGAGAPVWENFGVEIGG